MEKNIFESYNFNEKYTPTISQYLWGLKDGLVAKTQGKLSIYVDSFSVLGSNLKTQLTHGLYVITPKFRDYKKLILSVNHSQSPYYPVVVKNELTSEEYKNVQEVQLMDIVEKIILNPEVKKTIEALYKMSREKH